MTMGRSHSDCSDTVSREICIKQRIGDHWQYNCAPGPYHDHCVAHGGCCNCWRYKGRRLNTTASGDSNTTRIVLVEPSAVQRHVVHVENRANTLITLVMSCEQNHTLGLGEVLNVTLYEGETIWVVTQGTSFDCRSGCESCFHARFTSTGLNDTVRELGYGFLEDDSEWEMVNETENGMHGEFTRESPDIMEEYAAYEPGNMTVFASLRHNSNSNSGRTLVISSETAPSGEPGVPVFLRGSWSRPRNIRCRSRFHHPRRVCRRLCHFSWPLHRRNCHKECRCVGR